MNMKKAVIDLTNCKYIIELHTRIQKALDFPEWCGKNWSAFWDLLHRECKYDFISVIGADTVAKELKPQIEIMKKLMEKDKQEWAEVNYLVDYEFID